jgi:hypothetical protein
LYADLTAKAIENFAKQEDIQDYIVEQLWWNIDVLCSWFKIGGKDLQNP